MSKVKIKCDWCKKQFDVYPSVLKKKKKMGIKNNFCSRKHYGLWMQENKDGYWSGKKMPFYKRPNKDIDREKNPNWKGGRRTDKDGYILVLKKDHPNCDYHGYVREHRLVMEKKIGRYLEKDEVVHHRDKNKKNNNIDNLELYENGSKHQKEHYHSGDAKHIKHSPGWKKENS